MRKNRTRFPTFVAIGNTLCLFNRNHRSPSKIRKKRWTRRTRMIDSKQNFGRRKERHNHGLWRVLNKLDHDENRRNKIENENENERERLLDWLYWKQSRCNCQRDVLEHPQEAETEVKPKRHRWAQHFQSWFEWFPLQPSSRPSQPCTSSWPPIGLEISFLSLNQTQEEHKRWCLCWWCWVCP
jgi:hypothetical protein